MPKPKREHPKEKTRLHPRNKHRERYDFKQLIVSCPEMAPYVKLNMYDDESIDFSDPEAVKVLNKALLLHFYGLGFWDIPAGYLCPPIPGRADYIHHMADLLCSKNYGKIPAGQKIKCLDIGTGANCVYPVIGNREYGWSFTGSDIDPIAIEAAKQIVELNPVLAGNIEFRLQPQPNDIFFGVIQKEEYFDLTICNPPFHASLAEATSGTMLKLSNLNDEKAAGAVLNFGGRNNELWCKGGEEKFIRDMIRQSKFFAESCFWFSTLVSKQSHLKGFYLALEKEKAVEVKTIPMGQGNKSSRILAWTFLTQEQQGTWRSTHWGDPAS
ncbi:MAG: 23S rRNA (adenine(1618)-N(6))-methyltransferase RlmF [Bacteroidetes bacterium]|nr:23S rRNA (adenine(1618)-N(6))-methyltransferase RlmF [Bacteroidota bacterium]